MDPAATATAADKGEKASDGVAGDAGLSIPGYDPSKRDPRYAFSGVFQIFFELMGGLCLCA